MFLVSANLLIAFPSVNIPFSLTYVLFKIVFRSYSGRILELKAVVDILINMGMISGSLCLGLFIDW